MILKSVHEYIRACHQTRGTWYDFTRETQFVTSFSYLCFLTNFRCKPYFWSIFSRSLFRGEQEYFWQNFLPWKCISFPKYHSSFACHSIVFCFYECQKTETSLNLACRHNILLSYSNFGGICKLCIHFNFSLCLLMILSLGIAFYRKFYASLLKEHAYVR